jgi:hypothetical protein
MNLDNLGKSVKQSRRLVLITLVLLPLIYFFWFYVILDYKLSTETTHWGEFGDFLGGILNPLIAIFAVYWLSQSIMIQKQELSETRDALNKSQKAQTKQAELALLAARIDSLNMKLNIINSQLSSKLSYRNILLGASRVDQTFLTEDGEATRVSKIIPRLNAEIEALRSSQAEMLIQIEELLNET